jgi:hypothetical protein
MRWPKLIERLLCALLLCSGTTPAASASAPLPDTLAQVHAAAESGEFAAALQLARSEVDPLTALRCEVWLHYRARDFALAQTAAERALELSPDELWLAERALACALWRRDPQQAQLGLRRMERIFAQASAAERERFAEPLARAESATGGLLDTAVRASKAAARARAVGLSLLAAAVACLAYFALGAREAARSQ